MAKFNYKICDPLIKDVIDKGIVSSSDVCIVFNEYDWKGELNKVISAENQSEVYYSPSIEFENIDTLNCISISCVQSESADGYFFYVFHYYPKQKLSFIDKLSKKRPILEKEKLDQNHDQVIEILDAFIKLNAERLNEKFFI